LETLSTKICHFTNLIKCANISLIKKGDIILEKDLRGKFQEKKENILNEINKGDLSLYKAKIKSLEYEVLSDLDGLSSYLYLATLLDENPENFKKEAQDLLNEKLCKLTEEAVTINTEIVKYQAELKKIMFNNRYNLLINDAQTIKSALMELPEEEQSKIHKHYVVSNKSKKIIVEIQEMIKELQSKQAELNNKIQELQSKKEQIIKTTTAELKSTFILDNKEEALKYRAILLNNQTEYQAFYKLMQTEQGYNFLQSKLSEAKEIEEKKAQTNLTIRFSLGLPESVLNYLENEFKASHFTLKANMEEMFNIHDELLSTLKQLYILKLQLEKYSPVKFKQIKTENSDIIERAAKLFSTYNFTEKDPIAKTYFDKTRLFENSYKIYQKLKNSAIYSKKDRTIISTLEPKLRSDSYAIYYAIGTYIRNLYSKALHLINSSFALKPTDIDYLASYHDMHMLELDEFITGIESVIHKINACINSLKFQGTIYDDELTKIASELSDITEEPVSTEELLTSEDLFVIYKNVYISNITNEIENQVENDIAQNYQTANGPILQKRFNDNNN
jgi:hypothetical protein